MALQLLRASFARAALAPGARFASSAAAADALPKFSVVRHQVTADAIKPEDHFAVVKLGGTQYKVTQVRFEALGSPLRHIIHTLHVVWLVCVYMGATKG